MAECWNQKIPQGEVFQSLAAALKIRTGGQADSSRARLAKIYVDRHPASRRLVELMRLTRMKGRKEAGSGIRTVQLITHFVAFSSFTSMFFADLMEWS